MKRWIVALVCLGIPIQGYAFIPVQETGLALVETIIQTGQSITTAANTATSNTNEVLQINQQIQAYEQQLRGYVQDAKHLVALPMSYIEQVEGLYAQYNAAMAQARGIAFTVQNGLQQFEQLYAVATTGGVPLMQRAQALAAQVRNAGRAATEMTAIFDRLCAQQATVTHLQTVSLAAPGTLAAQQASNQLLAVLAEQNGSLQQIQASMGRVQISMVMQDTVANEQAQQNAQQFMQGFGDGTLRGPGQGQGFELPR